MYYWSPDYRQVMYPYYPYYQYGLTTPQAGAPQPGLTPSKILPAGATQPTVPIPSGATVQLPMVPGAPPLPTAEESYVENILRFNRGKIGTFRFTFENNPQWNAVEIRGRIETAGRDHIILSDPRTGKRYLMQMVNFDYAEFDEPLAYIPPYIPPVLQQELTTGTAEGRE